nr:FIST C-terminal domain-containing protein [uncultured Anaeromusa sp.]
MSMQGWLSGSRGDAWLAQLKHIEWKENEILVLLVASSSQKALPVLWKWARDKGLLVAGSLFPALIHGEEVVSEGACWLRFPLAAPVLPLYPKQEEPPWRHDVQNTTAFLLFNCQRAETEHVLEGLYDYLGHSIRCIGAVGECDLAETDTGLFTQAGWCEAAGLAVFAACGLHTSRGYGFSSLPDVLVVTKAEKNRILELNWQPALTAYQGVLAAYGMVLDDLGHYPLGMVREESVDLVRSIVEIAEDGSLVCAGEVPENAVLSVLVAEGEAMAASAALAAEEVEVAAAQGALIVNCYARAQLEGAVFTKELSAIRHNLQRRNPKLDALYGVLSYGEIVLPSEGVLELCNKTVVIGVMV